MIKSFKSKETARIFERLRSTKLPQDIQQVSYRKLRMLNNAVTLNDLRVPPANRLEKLSGDRAGQYSIRINDQWRICFEWIDGDAYNAEPVIVGDWRKCPAHQRDRAR
jgi:proteic killer suppression protein